MDALIAEGDGWTSSGIVEGTLPPGLSVATGGGGARLRVFAGSDWRLGFTGFGFVSISGI